MGGKAKFQKHTAKELAAKHAKNKNKGGGSGGLKSRTNAKLKLAYVCAVCMSASPDIKSLEQHYTSKHPKVKFDKEDIEAKARAKAEAMAAKK